VSRKREHYSYAVYADRAMARSFDDRRFGGPIGELVAVTQARVVAGMIGPLHDCRILDVGTGTGRAALMFARQGARVTAVDASDEMLQVARQRAMADGIVLDIRRGDAHDLEFADRAFEVGVCLRVLMHAPDWERCLAELCRVSNRLVIFDYPAAAAAAAIECLARRVKQAAGAGGGE
jgi:2-polyprenyl-3-methyl-5-hydroxy-6-metoxy-1,4-benzoquinol methylase